MRIFRFEVVNFENGDKRNPVVVYVFEQSCDSEHDAAVKAHQFLSNDANRKNLRVNVYKLITQVS